LDSDDVWQFDKLSKQLAVLNNDEDLVVWSEGDIIDENSTVLAEKFTERHHAQNKKKSGNIFDSLIDNNFIFQSSFIIKTENLKGIRLNDGLKYLNDYLYVVKLATEYKYYFIKEPLAKYRMHNKSTVLRDVNGYIADEIKLRTYFIQNFSEKLSSDLIRLNHARVVELLNSRIIELSSQNTALSSQIAEMRQSILWQLIMIYQNGFVERFLPMNSQRRKSYDLGLKGSRVLVNEGASKFCTKLYNYIINIIYKKIPKKLSVIIAIDAELGEKLSILGGLSLWNLRYVEFVLLNCTDKSHISDNFKIVTNEKEISFSEALNIAVTASTGKYILILKDGKLLNDDNLIYLLDFIDKILAGEHLFCFPCDASEKEMVSYDHIASYAYSLNDICVDKKYCLTLSDLVFLKKKWIDSLGGFDDSFKTTQYIKNNLNSLADNINYKYDILNEAAHRFNAEPSTLRCLKMSSNSVYECQINDTDKILRVLRRSIDWVPLVKGEIDWINYLSDNGVPVCRAILSTSGNYVEVIERPKDLFLVSLFTKARGHAIDLSNDCEWNDALFKKWGALMGRMHYLSKDYDVTDPSTKRMDWNYDFFFDPQFNMGEDNEKNLRIWRGLVDELNSLPKNNGSYGLVHNDFHYNNFKYYGNAITVIDFDGCVYNWFVADIAISFYHAFMTVPENERNEFAGRFTKNFFIGYYSENNLDNYWIDLLPTFIQLRHIYCYLFYRQNWNQTTLTSDQRKIMAAMKSSIESERPLIDISFKDIWVDIAFRDPGCN